jgi:hypothetical protein
MRRTCGGYGGWVIVLLALLASSPSLAERKGAGLKLRGGVSYVKSSEESLTSAKQTAIADSARFPDGLSSRLRARLPKFYASWQKQAASYPFHRAFYSPRRREGYGSSYNTNSDHDVDGRRLPPSLCGKMADMGRCYPQIDNSSPRVVRFFRGITVEIDALKRLDPNYNLRRGEQDFAAPDLRACLGVGGIGSYALPDSANEVGVIFEYQVPASFLYNAKWSFVLDGELMKSAGTRTITPFVSRVGVVKHASDTVEWYSPRAPRAHANAR